MQYCVSCVYNSAFFCSHDIMQIIKVVKVIFNHNERGVKMDKYMISDAARMVNVESHVLRYWEEELGLEVHKIGRAHV